MWINNFICCIFFYIQGSVGGEGEVGGSAVTVVAGGDGSEKEVPVDESLFMEEEGEDPDNQGNDNGEVEDEVPVDESLFDIENLDIDDPSVSQTQQEET